MNSAIEHIAQAFYYAEGTGQSWDYEFDLIKEEYRRFARLALEVLERHRDRLPDARASQLMDCHEAA